MSMPEISIIISAYNATEYLEKSILSVKTQNPTMFEFVIVDNASTDHTSEVIESLRKKTEISIKKVSLSENVGPGGGRDAGIPYATGRYITFMDSDDGFTADGAEQMLKAVEGKETDYFICGYSGTDRQADETAIFRRYPVADNKIWMKWYGCFVWRMLFKREFIVKNDVHFPKCYNEDLVFIMDVAVKAKSLELLPFEAYMYTRNRKSTSTKLHQNWEKMPESRSIVFEKLKVGYDITGEEEKKIIRYVALDWLYQMCLIRFAPLPWKDCRYEARELKRNLSAVLGDYKKWKISAFEPKELRAFLRCANTVCFYFDKVGCLNIVLLAAKVLHKFN